MSMPVNTAPAADALWRLLLVLCALAAGTVAPPLLAQESYSEEAVKAAFVFRFTGYVTWPEDALPRERFTIAVLGAEEFADDLQSLLAGRPLLNRPVLVRRIRTLQEAEGAQVLYVGGSDRRELRRLAAAAPSRGMLVVTESTHGLPENSIINLLVIDRHVRFEIALDTAQQAALKISSDLLALAVRVQQ